MPAAAVDAALPRTGAAGLLRAGLALRTEGGTLEDVYLQLTAETEAVE